MLPCPARWVHAQPTLFRCGYRFFSNDGLIFLERHLLEFKYKCAGYIVASNLSGNAKPAKG